MLKNAANAYDVYRDLVFASKNNRPTQQFIVQECMDLVTRHIQENKTKSV